VFLKRVAAAAVAAANTAATNGAKKLGKAGERIFAPKKGRGGHMKSIELA